MKKSLIILLLGFLPALQNVVAQQDSQYTQYMYNTAVINPAYSGSRDVVSIVGLHRTQWLGLDGAPKTITFAASGPVSDNIGLGISVISNKIGPSNETSVSADMSYNIRLNYNYRIFFGLKGSMNLLNVDFSKLNQFNPNDPDFQYNINNDFAPNIGVGFYLQSERTYVGISAPRLLETNHISGERASQVQRRVHYYFMAGRVFDLSNDVKFKPALLTDFTAGDALQVNVSGNFLFYEKLTLGVAYRWSAACSALAGFQITKGFFAGYAYDADTTNLGNYNSGSHEIFLRFELSKKINKVFSPRFF
ncbi:membrane protein [Flavobacterium collinsii]|uniref:PorP/SprF family type IX secretion system membrane protein n=1 Tax=Flavobacterium collinsii TaxID=1114861 RepID=UPI0022BDED9C|nr:type IX secretion system membrane protein PorP/SprF [Flavobacterium collinsii]GIQ61201.1 membrane protein [Flavobacterium collinsii]